MDKRLLIFFALIFVFMVALSVSPVLAKNADKDESEIPEQDGTYDVPGHPNLKVRVFVHHPKPQPTPSDALVCNLSDPDSSSVVDPAGWHLPSSWTYNLNLSSVPYSVGSSKLPTIADNAFAEWLSPIRGKINFSRGSDTLATRQGYDGKNIITWGRTSASALAVTYTWYYPDIGLVAEVDTIMNNKYAWSWTPYTTNACVNTKTYDAQDILTHELGHWVGLNDEYTGEYVNNTMFGYGSKAEIKKEFERIVDQHKEQISQWAKEEQRKERYTLYLKLKQEFEGGGQDEHRI